MSFVQINSFPIIFLIINYFIFVDSEEIHFNGKGELYANATEEKSYFNYESVINETHRFV